MKFKNLTGIYPASVTPLHTDGSFDREGLLRLLDFFAGRGAHGALLLGTTGEGPSFSFEEKKEIIRIGVKIRETHPDFRLFAGTGSPSLEETIETTRVAFEMGCEGVLVLPPYYFRKASVEGLFNWFDQLLARGVPEGGAVFGYHIPPISDVPLPVPLIARLLEAHPNKFAGIKDSSKSLDDARAFGDHFGEDLVIFNGTDRLLSEALDLGANSAITALGNIVSPDLRAVWDAHQKGEKAPAAQRRLTQARDISDRFPPAPPFLKSALHAFHGFPKWEVKPPLVKMDEEREERALLAWRGRGKIA